jgi:two-component system copper resistance phosphate regulon response regulator CusR
MEILQRLRKEGSSARILILTAKDALNDRVQGLNAGADDYLIKPFALEELLARVNVLVRRRYDQVTTLIKVGDLTIDTSTQEVRRAGAVIEFTKREYSLLVFLAVRAGKVVSRTDIWENVYDFESDAHSNVIDVYIRYLRQKLEKNGLSRMIHTRRGFGYVLTADDEVDA